MALAFVRIMGSLVNVPKGWFRNVLWLFFYTPVRAIVMLFPYILAMELFFMRQTKDVDVFVMVSILFFASLMPATGYVRRHRQFIFDVINR